MRPNAEPQRSRRAGKPSPQKPSNRLSKTHVTRRAREIADTGDRWFLSMASGLGRLGGWTRHEANIVADSAVAAFFVTVRVAKKLVGGGKGPGTSHAAEEVDSMVPPARTSAPVGPSGSGIDLVPAVPAEPRREMTSSCASDGPSTIEIGEIGALPDAPTLRNAAGVVPLLQALGRTVASYTNQGYASLQQDDRFWTLIHLLQRLGRPSIACAPNEADPPGHPDRHSNYDPRSEP